MEGKQIACIAILAVVIVGVGFGATVIVTYNDCVTAKLQAENEWARIYVEFERKVELIPQLVDVVENYTAFEQETLTLITALRTQWLSLNGSPSEQANISSQLNLAFNTLFVAIEENYPLLQADTLYLGLFDEITGAENRITMAKLDYNDAVTAYNTKIATFPGFLVAGMFGLEPMNLYGGT